MAAFRFSQLVLFRPAGISHIGRYLLLQPLRTVSAYKDDGPVLAVPTRWCPRKVLCKETHTPQNVPERRYAVKYRRRGDPASSAAAISEVVSHALMKMIGLRTLDAVLVQIDVALSLSYGHSGKLDYAVDDGLHFGTLLRLDFQPGPPPRWEQIARPEELIAIWAADTWLMNLDRGVYGNILLEQEGSGSQWHLIPADQSDCFLGSLSLSDGFYRQRAQGHRSAPYLPMLERALYEKGPQPLQRMVSLIRQTKDRIPDAIARVPPPWWQNSGVRPDELTVCLRHRADQIHALVDLAHWENLPYGSDGATILDL